MNHIALPFDPSWRITIACNGAGGRVGLEINASRAGPLMRIVLPGSATGRGWVCGCRHAIPQVARRAGKGERIASRSCGGNRSGPPCPQSPTLCIGARVLHPGVRSHIVIALVRDLLRDDDSLLRRQAVCACAELVIRDPEIHEMLWTTASHVKPIALTHFALWHNSEINASWLNAFHCFPEETRTIEAMPQWSWVSRGQPRRKSLFGASWSRRSRVHCEFRLPSVYVAAATSPARRSWSRNCDGPDAGDGFRCLGGT